MPKRPKTSTIGVSAWMISGVFIGDIAMDGSFADKKPDQ